MEKKKKDKIQSREFPGSPVRTWHFPSRGLDSISRQETKIPQMTQPKKGRKNPVQFASIKENSKVD